jgi:hypothetical protein
VPRRDIVIRGAGVLIVAGVLAGGGAYIVNEGGTLEANAFINTDVTGDTCTRSATPVTFEEAEAANDLCGTFDVAHAAAENGDLILIRDGDYEDQVMNGPAKAAGAQITFRAQNDGAVTVDSLDLTDVTQITFEDFTVTDPDFAGPASNKMVDLVRADDLVFDGVDINRAWETGDGLGITNSVDRLTFRNGSICCAKEAKLIQMQKCCDGSATGHTDILFENVEVHHAVWATSTDDGDPHFECWWIDAVDGLTLRNVKTWNCGSTGNIYDDTGAVDVLFSNTIWEAKRLGTSMTDVVAGAEVGYLGPKGGISIDGSPAAGSTGIFEYSIIESGIITTGGWSALTIRSNITGFASCGGGAYTYSFNKHTAADCSASDTQVATVLNSGNYVDQANQDWHAANCSTPQIDAGDTSSYPAADFDGVSRYLNAAPDIGPYEKAC